MLNGLLETLAEGGAHRPRDLARALGVGEDLLQQMLRDLSRMGYLKPIGGECGVKCQGCPVTAGCAVGGRGYVWSLTEKGSRAVQELQ